MAWIKRNLFFVIGTVIALALMGVAGFYLYTKWQLNDQIWEKLNTDYAELKRFSEAKPHPGSGKVKNITTAKEQQQEVRAFIQKVRAGFVRISPIPDMPKPSDRDFSAALSRTIDQLRRDATNSSVSVPANYNFSFQAQYSKVSFAPGSTDPLAVQLGEIKTICSALFAAKINSLDSIRRERVSPDDAAGQLTDYLSEKTITNELALLTPYEFVFRCFTPELASALAELAASSHGLIVKTINVEAAPAVTTDVIAAAPVTPNYSYVPPPAVTQTEAFKNRYGIGAGGPRRGEGPYMAAPPPPPPVAVMPAGPAVPVGRGGLPIALDERQLKVTMNILVVKLLPPK